MKEAAEHIVIITGAARGIGYAIAEAFAAQGDIPVLVDLSLEEASNAALQLKEKYGCDAGAYGTDVSDAGSVRKLVEDVVDRWGRIDVVVNNAGLQHVSPVEDFPVEKWDLLMNVMLKGPFLFTKYIVPHMKRRQYGRIINIASVHGRVASPFKSAYVAAKHGLVGLTRTVALEVAADHITVNAVMPGVVRTALIENQLESLAEQDGTSCEEALQKHLLHKQAIKRFIQPEEVATVCVFLASVGAGSITGDTISVSGGW
jgi:3-hydroxybutyrate dehydrogenase